MNFNNCGRVRGYVRDKQFRNNEDSTSLFFSLLCKRSYKSKQTYDIILCKAFGNRAINMNQHILDNQYIEVSGEFESFYQSIENNQLVSYQENLPKVLRHILTVEFYHCLESKEVVKARLDNNRQAAEETVYEEAPTDKFSRSFYDGIV
ncbi:hypothetical protein M2139_001498 [Enterococcus sp. PF1-24]|uniref:hypothetical protein n=1 Tax=unclassified Enterococcus TaxID=2608891 RepID=UPI0024749D11|nr:MULTISPECIES: hypothetical protein [unclassified Enterococcus]MDH6364511.1 hypothetical protein [Enterococcus sp. PFB1-1]MDH6401612.1 hypothetical protein [Enterococcus sp. PF1-24]